MFCTCKKWNSWVKSALCGIQLYMQSGSNGLLLSLKKLDVLDIESHLLNFNQSECTSSDLGFFIKLADGQFLA